MVVAKSNVRVKVFTPHLLRMLETLTWLDTHPVQGQPAELCVTSINDSTHRPDSKHYLNLALDLRIKTFTPDARDRFVAALRHELGPDFLVLYEGDGTPNAHLHLQVRL